MHTIKDVGLNIKGLVKPIIYVTVLRTSETLKNFYNLDHFTNVGLT